MQFTFYKYQGTGNDFVLIDNRERRFPEHDPVLVKKICDRRFGIGADGLMLLEHASDFDFKMVYYNADGNESTMCGNGGRCIAAFAKKLGITKEHGTFSAIDGGHDFILKGEDVRLKMIDVPDIRKDGEAYVLFTGSPHYVVFENSIDKIDIVQEARKIRYNHTYAEKGINVNYAEEKNGKIFMRTYERGVEDETLSCGTGTVAVALCTALRQELGTGTIEILTPGGNLYVSFKREGSIFTDIWLEGPATIVFEGTIKVH